MKIGTRIAQLAEYGVRTGLLYEEDRIYAMNQLLEALKLDEAEGMSDEVTEDVEAMLPEILGDLVDDAYDRGLLPDNGIVQRDLFDTKLMNCLMPRPSEVIRTFREKYDRSPEEATNYYYKLSQDSNYIRRDRIKKDLRWTVESPYGTIDISVNLSKPEKDPKAIAAAKLQKQTSYPKCQLCIQNEGYAGRVNHPARQTHRIIPITINEDKWGFQYSPYVYYNEHCIILNGSHTPMAINRSAFIKLFDFVKQFPHYFLGSNADLPIVGGSILTHDHFQGGHYTFAMAKAPYESRFTVSGYEDVETGIIKWPMSAIRIRHKDTERLIDLADHILGCWRGYTDEAAFIFAETDGEPHNTITPIARKNGDMYELDLVLRNNITTEEHPLGVYHPHAQWHNIKKENIGLIEVMGLAVLPSRLKNEMELIAECLATGRNVNTYPELFKHEAWVNEWVKKYDDINYGNVWGIIKEEVGQVFVHVLEDAGVYKCDEEGRKAFARFIETL